jgi:hypothetical protein
MLSDVLPLQLLKAVAYDERRRIRAQIRIAKRQMEEANTTTTLTKTTRTTSSAPATKVLTLSTNNLVVGSFYTLK